MASRTRGSKDHATAELQAMSRVVALLDALEPDAARRVMTWVSSRLGLEAAVAGPAMPPAAGDDALGVFVRRKSPSTNAERVLCLGYFLARQVGQSQFRTRDLSRLNDGAGLEKFTNTAMAVKAARLKGWLTVKGGVIALTSVGTQLVEALPNRTAALVQSRAAAVRLKKSPKGKRRG